MYPAGIDEDAVTSILAHEIAHVLASHKAEHLSKTSLFFFALAFMHPFVFLPYFALWHYQLSRVREDEADYIRMFLMAKAGYNIRTVPGSWVIIESAEDQKLLTICSCCNPDIPEVFEVLSSHSFVSYTSFYTLCSLLVNSTIAYHSDTPDSGVAARNH
jgi:hypothetical protein